jgi:hypothetical protein
MTSEAAVPILDEDDFVAKGRSILSSDRVKNILTSLLAQAVDA